MGISCSPRKGKTTAASVRVALEAAVGVSPDIETELIELAGMNIPVFDPANADKGTALEYICKRLGVPLRNTLAVSYTHLTLPTN